MKRSFAFSRLCTVIASAVAALHVVAGLANAGEPEGCGTFEMSPAVITLDQLPQAYAISATDQGDRFLKSGNYVRAIACYTDAIDTNPKYVRAFSHRGLAYKSLEDFPRAIADQTSAISLEPNVANHYVNRGNAYRENLQLDLSIGDHSKALSIEPNNVGALNGRCYARAQSGSGATAIPDCDRAIQILPVGAIFDTRGYAHLRMGNAAKAIMDYNEALRLDPSIAESWFGRGVAKGKTGDKPGSSADISKARSLDNRIDAKMARIGIVP
jgi:tetratricopeptide (TPR) repeat protein